MKRIIITIFLLLIFIPAFSINREESDKQFLKDSLNKLSQNDTSRLKILYDIIQLTYSKPTEQAEYVDIMLKEAIFHQNNEYICRAYLALIIIAYNNYDYDSAVKWKDKLEPLAMKEKLYDIMFQGKRVVIELLAIEEEFEKQESESNKLFQEAEALENKQGMIFAKQSLSNTYLETYRYKDAASILEDVLVLEPKLTTKLEIYFTLIAIYKALNDLPNTFKCTQAHDKVAHEYMRENPTKKDVLMQNYILLTDYYICEDNLKLATKYLDSVHYYYSDDYSDILKTIYNENCCSYYNYTKQYDKAIEHIDSAIKRTEETFFKNYFIKFLLIKADLLRNNNRHEEAVKWYKIGVEQMDSIRLVKITKQEEYLKKKLDAHNYTLESQTIQNYHTRIIIIAVIIILIVLIYFIYYTIKVRYQLKKDENEMRVMTEEMEMASKAKDNFLNNISNSISLPLNYIVENSQRLGSDEEFTAEQKIELSASLRVYSSKLMAMINDILDFSRLEAGMMKLNKEEKNVVVLISEVLNKEENLKNINISWQLSTTEGVYLAVVDILRFQVLINSMLQSIDDTSSLYVLIEDNNEANELYITVRNSWLSVINPSQDIIIRNEINKSMMQQFNGVYNINTNTNTISIMIKYVFVV